MTRFVCRDKQNLPRGYLRGKRKKCWYKASLSRFPLRPPEESEEHTEVPRRLFAYFLVGEKVGPRRETLPQKRHPDPASRRSQSVTHPIRHRQCVTCARMETLVWQSVPSFLTIPLYHRFLKKVSQPCPNLVSRFSHVCLTKISQVSHENPTSVSQKSHAAAFWHCG